MEGTAGANAETLMMVMPHILPNGHGRLERVEALITTSTTPQPLEMVHRKPTVRKNAARSADRLGRVPNAERRAKSTRLKIPVLEIQLLLLMKISNSVL
jgi:hypothetical protein